MISKKILVIGSNSFSGSHFIAESLRAGHFVSGVSRSEELDNVFLPYRWNDDSLGTPLANKDNFKHQIVDLNKNLDTLFNLIDNDQPNIIVNFAAQGMVAESWKNPTDWYRTNVLSQVALHNELRNKKFLEKYVHVTTPEVYGSTDGGWIKENNYFTPSTPYAVSRAACDMHLNGFYKAYNFPVVFTRAANVYGPGQQLYRIIPRTILSVLTGKKMDLHGGGYSERSFIHISDVVKATLTLATDASPGTTWHLSTNESISIRKLVEKICESKCIDFESIVNVTEERLGKDQSYLLDSSAVRETFGWTDKVSLDDGIRETFLWVEENLCKLSKIPWIYEHKT